MDLAAMIDDAFRAGAKGITIWPSDKHGYQANVQNPDGSWRVMTGSTPTKALTRALGSLDQPKRRRRMDDLI